MWNILFFTVCHIYENTCFPKPVAELHTSVLIFDPSMFCKQKNK